MSNSQDEPDEYEPVDEQYTDIVNQIDYEERLYYIHSELKDYTYNVAIPLLENLNIEILSDFLTPDRVRVF